MKVSRKRSPTSACTIIDDGRHIGTVIQVVHVGRQLAFDGVGPPTSRHRSRVFGRDRQDGPNFRVPPSLFFGLQIARGLGDADELGHPTPASQNETPPPGMAGASRRSTASAAHAMFEGHSCSVSALSFQMQGELHEPFHSP